ncbi:hypothetical protein GCM10009779_02450 [Polymorphospora rubra]|uniref:Transcriptional regulator n=2 Tax=Polymorphospora rubra TaxID=338584 RepID=A0A810MXB1_9ACTN|nr:hypothetical protein Prubr_27330 [Polymorphospora rubra]
MSRQELADAINEYLADKSSPDGPIDRNQIGRLERGLNRWPRAPRRAAFRAVLGAGTDAELGFYNIRRPRMPAATGAEPVTAVRRNEDAGSAVAARGRLISGKAGIGLPVLQSAAWSSSTVPSTGMPAYTGQVEPPDVLTRVDQFIADSAPPSAGEVDYQHLVRDLIEWACRMHRRDILQWLSWAAASAAAAPILDDLDADERERTLGALVTPSRVDDTVIDHIDAVLWRCMRQDDTLGPQAALDTVLAQRGLVGTLLPQAPAAVRDRLLSLYANLSRFAGWLAFDLNNYDAASTYYESARAAAHDAQNTELGAFVLCNMSHLASWRGQPRIGVDHALAAQGWAAQTSDLSLRAYAFDVAARALAMDGQHTAVMRSLEQARTALEQAQKPSTWVYFFSLGQLHSTESICHLHLGDADRAARIAEDALATINTSFVRNLAMTTLRLGIARLRATKPDIAQAAKAIGDAARLAAHNRSARLVERLQRGWRELEPWHNEPEVKDIREQLVAYGLT